MKTGKKALALVLSLLLVLSAVVLAGTAVSADDDSYVVGDTLFYGTYPQSRVTDEELLSRLEPELMEEEWTSFDYYSGNNTEANGAMKAGDFMLWQDIVLSGVKYRAVRIDSYRPMYTADDNTARYSNQDDNSYTAENIYWFAYEPIKWRVLDPDFGLIVSDSAIDSQAFNNFMVRSDNKYWGSTDRTYYANDYSQSSIREWLNSYFITTAFSSDQAGTIKPVMLNNNCPDSTLFNAPATEDQIFLLSYYEVQNEDFGFSSDDDRLTTTTDYARCQGIFEYEDTPLQWLRTPTNNTSDAYFIVVTGSPDYSNDVTETDIGICPAMALTELKNDPTGAPLYGGVGHNVGDEEGGIPKLRINNETNFWEVSYDGGTTWTSLGVKATGDEGPIGVSIDTIYIDGNNHLIVKLTDGTENDLGPVSVTNINVTAEGGETVAVTPKLQINEETNYWEVSYDNGETWTSLGVKATGKTGADGVGIENVEIDSDGNLIITLTNGNSFNLGKITGENGQNGVGIASTEINRSGELLITLTNGRTFNLGKITGEDGRNGADGKDAPTITSMSYNKNGELIIKMSDGTEINAGKPGNSAYDTDIKKPVVTISGYQKSRTVDYGTSITFHSTADFIPEGYELRWFVNGEDKGNSDTLTVTDAASDFTVCARLMKNGSSISESKVEKVTVKSDFFSRIIAFFKKLFTPSAFIIDQK